MPWVKTRITMKNLDSATKSIALNISGSFAIKGMALVVGFVTTPAYMSYFSGNSILGLWFTLLSLLTWILFCDLGLGNGLRNKLVFALSLNDYTLARRYISSTFVTTACISIMLCAILYTSVEYVDWSLLFNIDQSNYEYDNLKTSLRIVFLGVVLQLFLRTSESILYAMQKAVIPSILALSTNVIVLVYLVMAVAMNCAGSIVSLSFVYVLATNIPLLIVSAYLFFRPLSNCRPSFKYFSKELGREVCGLGGVFFFLQVSALMIGTSMVTLLISTKCGPDAVVVYSVYNKLFSQFYVVVTIAMVPMWSAVTKAMEEKRFSWIGKAYRKVCLFCLLLFASQLLLLPVLQFVFDLWLGVNTISVNLITEIVFIVNTGVMIIYSATSYMCNGLNEVKGQFVFMALAAVSMGPLAYYLTNMNNSFEMVVIAQTLALLPYCVFQTLRLRKIIAKKTLYQ